MRVRDDHRAICCRECNKRLAIAYPNRPLSTLLLYCSRRKDGTKCDTWTPRPPLPGTNYHELQCGMWGIRPLFPGDTAPRLRDERGCARTFGYVGDLPIGTAVHVDCPHCSGITNMVGGAGQGRINQWVEDRQTAAEAKADRERVMARIGSDTLRRRSVE